MRGRTQPDRVVVPRSTVRSGAVYLADNENRLRRRPVEVPFWQGALSVIGKGLAPGERVVVSELVPAVEGMLLEPRVNKALTAKLEAAAGGESRLSGSPVTKRQSTCSWPPSYSWAWWPPPLQPCSWFRRCTESWTTSGCWGRYMGRMRRGRRRGCPRVERSAILSVHGLGATREAKGDRPCFCAMFKTY